LRYLVTALIFCVTHVLYGLGSLYALVKPAPAVDLERAVEPAVAATDATTAGSPAERSAAL
jgi:hypothetical protein